MSLNILARFMYGSGTLREMLMASCPLIPSHLLSLFITLKLLILSIRAYPH